MVSSPRSSDYSSENPFEYSTARPPTGFSAIIPSPHPNPPREPLPTIPPTPSTTTTDNQTSSKHYIYHDEHESKYGPDEAEVKALDESYHRSDWMSTAQTTSDWSRSSYIPTSRPPQTGKSFLTPGWTSKTTPKVQFAEEQELAFDSPSEFTPFQTAKTTASHEHNRLPRGKQSNKNEWNHTEDTLPSIISFSNLTNSKPKISNPSHSMSPSQRSSPSSVPKPPSNLVPPSVSPNMVTREDHDPFSDPMSSKSEIHQRVGYSISRSNTPESNIDAQLRLQDRDAKKSRNETRPKANTQQTTLLDPTDQNRLGRMSVAPARYTLPHPRRDKQLKYDSSLTQPPSANAKSSKRRHALDQVDKKAHKPQSNHKVGMAVRSKLLWYRMKTSKVGKSYLTWRPFISPCLALVCALILTVSNGISTNSLSVFIKIPKDVFNTPRTGAGDVPIGLGAWGWCQLNNDDNTICQSYTNSDFISKNGNFTIPADSSLDTLSSLLTALTSLTWLLATFQIMTAFLHFYLFFALSIPFNHLVESTLPRLSTGTTHANQSEKKDDVMPYHGTSRAKSKLSSLQPKISGEGKDLVVAEVDLRVKCERIPYEGYEWVWWAWWGHRRSPLQSIFAHLVGILGLATFAVTCKLKNEITHSTNSGDIEFGNGAYMSLMTVLFTLDTFILSFIYLFNFKSNFHIFLNPPSPSPRVLLLPPSEKPMQHHRRTGLASFFAPHSAPLGGRSSNGKAITNRSSKSNAATSTDGNTDTWLENTLPTKPELDEETVRWLSLYPQDMELVPLISGLRMGKRTNKSDFLLSEVGLLYLRPDNGIPEQQALLVPPKGVIRIELIQDAHFDAHPDYPPSLASEFQEGQIAHNRLEVMVDILSSTFWWNGMAIDCKEFVENCNTCVERLKDKEGSILSFPQLKKNNRPSY
ncbi:uncharacterized protein IL334_000544 [Kwoniella shivajii]|uniref:Integrase zinc-binding domain-containing protein n=1 Tax=Kwoniella shivajii TaxID=564305 RepID=A0ABZ1CSG8_9TREE|nr:hypothetical protein IL334_000544 [Kwoniella shivajii]